GLALGELDRDAGAVHGVADLADEVLVLGRLEYVVVLDERRVRRQPGVAPGPGVVEGVLEQVELELGAAVHRVPGRRSPLDLALEDSPRRHLDRLARLLVS